jgi:DNA replication protein DnaC
MKIQDLDQPDDLKVAFIEFARNPTGFLLLSGPNGTGKSTSAMAIYNSVTPFRLPAYDHDIAIFINQAELNIWWGENISKYGETNSMLKTLTNTKLLIIDDLGTRTPSDSFMDFLYAVVDKRSVNRNTRGTIITTNLNSKDLRYKFSDPFYSRVASGICFRMEGADRRFDRSYD